jgi:hypothetical protein
MGESWFVRPETCRLPLSDEQWVLVKQRLTAGEFRSHLKRSSDLGTDGVRRINTIDHGLSLIVAYLLDWSLDAPIRQLSVQDLTATLDGLDPQRFLELSAAIEAHDVAMTAARDQKKTTTTGETASDPTSPSRSVPAPASPTPTSEDLISTSTACS